MTTVDDLRRSLRAYSNTLRSERIRGSHNTIKITTLTGQSLLALYVKSAERGHGSQGHFWGINENRINTLSSRSYPWQLVLLLGDDEKCYLAHSEQVNKSIDAGNFSSQESRSDYKIHEVEIAGQWPQYPTFNDLFQALGLSKI